MARLLVIARLAGERVAFPADRVDAVVEIGAIIPVPGAAAHVAGLAALRSRVLTVIDCCASLDPGCAVAERRDALVVIYGGQPYALLVDRVEDAVEAEGEVSPPPVGLTPGWARVAAGQTVAEGELHLVADVAALIAGSGGRVAPVNRPLTPCR